MHAEDKNYDSMPQSEWRSELMNRLNDIEDKIDENGEKCHKSHAKNSERIAVLETQTKVYSGIIAFIVSAIVTAIGWFTNKN